jgi:N-acetylmuramoyl-L-alanine amidase
MKRTWSMYIGVIVIAITVAGFTPVTSPTVIIGNIPLSLLHSDEPFGPGINLFDARDKHCLAIAVYGEARGETTESMVAVAWVILNRTNSRHYPNTVCDVVLQSYQFESLGKGTILRDIANEANSGTMVFPTMNNQRLLDKIYDIADAVFYSISNDPTKGSTHFWSPIAQSALGRVPPNWAEQLAYQGEVGNHRFYR